MDILRSLVSNLSTLQVTAIIVGAAILLVKWTRTKSYRLPPGPFPLPLIGNILAFRGIPIIKKFSEWHKKYGPVCTFYVGPKRIVLLNDYDAMTEAFVKRGSDFSGRPYFYSVAMVTEGNTSISFGQYGDVWRYQRRLATHALRQYLTGTQLENRVHEALQPVIDSILSEKDAFDPQKHLNLSVFNIIHGLCFGKPMLYDDPQFQRIVYIFDKFAEVSTSGFAEDFIPPLRLWPTKTFRMTMEMSDEFNLAMHQKYEKHRKDFNIEKLNSLTDHIILAHDTLKEEDPNLAVQMTDTHAVQAIADVFAAGTDTTRTTLKWFFLVMVAYPEVQKRIQDEIDQVVGKELPGKEHRSKLVYLEAVLLETMRLYYIVPYNLPHETLRDSTVGGYEIPAKTIVVVNNHAIMHDARDWDKPWVFKPERFLDETQTKIMARHRSWVPFSMGHRSCLGESLAKLELVYIIAGLLQVLSFSLPPDTKADFTDPCLGIPNPPKPYKIIATPRNMK